MTSTAELSSPSSANTLLTNSVVDRDYTLEDKFTRTEGRIYLSGVQALVRLPLMQKLRDQAAGLNTGGFISGYRGSPLGGFDLELWRAKKHLAEAGVKFTPGLNEDLGATMVWGTQQTNLFPGATVDGVFGMWYGKGPGVDRCGDVFKHGNAAGTSKHGGVLALAADDHACRSSTLPHGSEGEFTSALMPILNPAGVQDILEMGLLGWAMSRYTGRWVGFKTIAETVESSASVDVNPFALQIVTPDDFEMPADGLNIRWPDPPLNQEMRLHMYAVKAAQAFARANRIDRTVIDSPNARLGIVTTGKSYLDVLQALEVLGLDERACADLGIRVYKVGMTWPLEPIGIRAFARGLEDILVVEEKHAFIESQMKELFYNFEGQRPSIVGKYDEAGEWILPSTNELTPARIARVIAKRLSRYHRSEHIDQQLAFLAQQGSRTRVAARQLPARAALLLRLPAQHLDRGPGRLARAGRHRLPLHGDVDGPRHRHLHPDGRRRRDLVRAGGVHRNPARLPEPRRRHLLPFRLAGDPPVGRRRRQHHLQDPLQRCGRDDRRPAGRRHAVGAADRAAGAQRGRAGDRRAQRRHRQVERSFDLPVRRRVLRPQGTRRGAEAPARSEGRVAC